MKKLAALGLALAMCLALAIPAFAASTQNFTTENSSLIPTVELEMPSAGYVILNPYQMTYTGTALGTTLSGDALKAQILSVPFNVTNKTLGANLKVSVAVTGVVAGNASLQASGNSIADDEKDNKVILKLDCGLTQTATATAPTAVPTSGKATMQLKEDEQSFSDIFLSPATSATEFTYITFNFSGAANTHPDTPWAERDTVGARFVFTFEPSVETASSGVSVAS